MTHIDIENLLQDAIQICKSNNIPISDSIDPHIEFPKAHSFYGMCCPNRSGFGYKFKIRISEYTLNNSYKSLMNTMLHELLHTCPGCLNHQALWRSYAKILNDKYGYNIQRCDGDKESTDKMNLRSGKAAPRKTITMRCNDCDREWIRHKESNFTLHPQEYRCKCGGRIVRVWNY